MLLHCFHEIPERVVEARRDPLGHHGCVRVDDEEEEAVGVAVAWATLDCDD